MSDLIKRRHLSLLICVPANVNISPFVCGAQAKAGSDNAHSTSCTEGSLSTSAGGTLHEPGRDKRQKTHPKNNYRAPL